MTHSLFWFRRDLRLADNPALQAALEGSQSLLPVYIDSPGSEGEWPAGSASRWWLHHSLTGLQKDLRRRGSQLCVLSAPDCAAALIALSRQFNCQRVIWTRLYEPEQVTADRQLAEQLNAAGIETLTCPGNVISEPDALHNKQGKPYRVFTPFWNNLQPILDHLGDPRPAPLRLPPLPGTDFPQSVESLNLLPKTDWAGGLRAQWSPGEDGAHQVLQQFLEQTHAYTDLRDRPDHEGTSRLSPSLHFGELSVRQVVHGIRYGQGDRQTTDANATGSAAYLRQLGWREFSRHLLWHFPHTVNAPMDERFQRFAWRRSKKDFSRWQQGQTGVPVIDAGMRQLWHSGWMHNRVRMLVASFLTKNLRLPWQWGAQWFWDTLVDADLANNTMGWQWVAGSGADAAPYFRLFNPVTQGKKFDPEGHYVRRWVPELAELPTALIHDPWQKPEQLRDYGLRLGKHYPKPMVDLGDSRRAALDAYAALKRP